MAGYLPSNLENLAGNDSLSQALDFVGWGQKRRFNEEALRAQRVNRDMALEDLYHTKQMNPMRVEEMSLKNALAGLRNEGQGYENKVAKRNLDVRESIPLEKEQQAAMSKIMTQLSDDDWKQTQNDIYKMMSSKEPREQALGQKLYRLLPEMVKLRSTLDSRETVAEIRKPLPRVGPAGRAGAQDSLTNMVAVINKQKGAGDRLRTVQTFLSGMEADDPRRMRLMTLENEFLKQVNTENRVRTAGKQTLDTQTGKFESPKGIELAPRSGEPSPAPAKPGVKFLGFE